MEDIRFKDGTSDIEETKRPITITNMVEVEEHTSVKDLELEVLSYQEQIDALIILMDAAIARLGRVKSALNIQDNK